MVARDTLITPVPIPILCYDLDMNQMNIGLETLTGKPRERGSNKSNADQSAGIPRKKLTHNPQKPPTPLNLI